MLSERAANEKVRPAQRVWFQSQHIMQIEHDYFCSSLNTYIISWEKKLDVASRPAALEDFWHREMKGVGLRHVLLRTVSLCRLSVLLQPAGGSYLASEAAYLLHMLLCGV